MPVQEQHLSARLCEGLVGMLPMQIDDLLTNPFELHKRGGLSIDPGP